MTLRSTTDDLSGDDVARRSLALYTNDGTVSSTLAEYVGARENTDLIPYLDIPELAPPESDVIIVLDSESFAAAAALIDEILVTRTADATVELVFSSLPDEVDKEFYATHLRYASVESVGMLGDSLKIAITKADDHGDLAQVLWQLVRSLAWFQAAAAVGASGVAALGDSADVRSGASSPTEDDAPTMSPQGHDRRTMSEPRSSHAQGRARIAPSDARRLRRRLLAALLAGLAVVAGAATAVVVDDPVVTTIIIATMSLGAVVIASALVIRRAVLAVGRRVARVEKSVKQLDGRVRGASTAQEGKLAVTSSEILHLRRSLASIHSDLRFSRSHNAIILETLGDRIRRADEITASSSSAQ